MVRLLQLSQQFRSTPAPYMPKSGNAGSLTSDFGANKTITIQNQHDVLNPAFQSSKLFTLVTRAKNTDYWERLLGVLGSSSIIKALRLEF